MFGNMFSNSGGGMFSPQTRNAFAAPTPGGPVGQGSAYGQFANAAQPFMQAGMPRFAGQQPGGNPPGLQGFMSGFPGAPGVQGGFGSLFPGNQFDPSQIQARLAAVRGQGWMQNLPPQIQQMLQEQLSRVGQGQASQGANVYGPSQLPSQWASPANLVGSMFNPSGYR